MLETRKISAVCVSVSHLYFQDEDKKKTRLSVFSLARAEDMKKPKKNRKNAKFQM